MERRRFLTTSIVIGAGILAGCGDPSEDDEGGGEGEGEEEGGDDEGEGGAY